MLGKVLWFLKKKNMDDEREITFQVGGYQSFSKVEKHFFVV
jgi:hypothetical protein